MNFMQLWKHWKLKGAVVLSVVLLGTLINAELGEPASLIVDYQMYDVSVRAHAFIILIFYTTSVLG